MSDFLIEEEVIEGYISLFHQRIEKDITCFFNEDFLVFTGSDTKSYSFLDSFIVILSLQDEKIKGISMLTYENFIPHQLFDDLIALDSLPSRIERYKRLDIQIFRHEVSEQLQLGNIYMDKNGDFAIWDEYNIRFTLDPYSNKLAHLL